MRPGCRRRPGGHRFPYRRTLARRRRRPEAAYLFSRRNGAPQELARAALPRAAVGVANIAEKKMLGRRSIAEIDIHFCRRVRHDHEIAAGTERRIEDRPEL